MKSKRTTGMLKRGLSAVCVLVLMTMMLAGCGKKKETVEEMLHGAGLKTFTEVTGAKLHEENVGEGSSSATYILDSNSEKKDNSDQMAQLVKQYKDYLTGECKTDSISSTDWIKEDLDISIFAEMVDVGSDKPDLRFAVSVHVRRMTD